MNASLAFRRFSFKVPAKCPGEIKITVHILKRNITARQDGSAYWDLNVGLKLYWKDQKSNMKM